MKAFKLILALIALILVIAVGAMVYLADNIDGLVKDLIESEGPKVTQTEVSVADVDIQLRQGRGQLSGFRIANPAGFESPHVLTADTFALDVEPRSIAGDVLVIDEILVDGVKIMVEQKGMTTNVQALLKAMREAAGESPGAESGEQSDLRLMVEHIRFSGSQLSLSTEQQGTFEMDLPALALDNIGSREQGLTPVELGREVLRPLIEKARQVAQQRLEKVLQDKAEGELERRARKQLGEDAEKKIERLKGLLNR